MFPKLAWHLRFGSLMAAVMDPACLFNLTLPQSSSSSNSLSSLKFHHHRMPVRPMLFRFHIPSANSLIIASSAETSSLLPEEQLLPLKAKASSTESVVNTPLDRGRDRRKVVRLAWEKLVRWSRSWRSKAKTDVLERTKKVPLQLFCTSWPK